MLQHTQDRKVTKGYRSLCAILYDNLEKEQLQNVNKMTKASEIAQYIRQFP